MTSLASFEHPNINSKIYLKTKETTNILSIQDWVAFGKRQQRNECKSAFLCAPCAGFIHFAIILELNIFGGQEEATTESACFICGEKLKRGFRVLKYLIERLASCLCLTMIDIWRNVQKTGQEFIDKNGVDVTDSQHVHVTLKCKNYPPAFPTTKGIGNCIERRSIEQAEHKIKELRPLTQNGNYLICCGCALFIQVITISNDEIFHGSSEVVPDEENKTCHCCLQNMCRAIKTSADSLPKLFDARKLAMNACWNEARDARLRFLTGNKTIDRLSFDAEFEGYIRPGFK